MTWDAYTTPLGRKNLLSGRKNMDVIGSYQGSMFNMGTATAYELKYDDYDNQPKAVILTFDQINNIPAVMINHIIQTNLPKVKKIIFSGPCTIVFWGDNTKTVVKCSDEDDDDPYTAVAYAYMKKIFGSNNQFKKFVDRFLPEEEKEVPNFGPWIALRASIIQMRNAEAEHQANLKKTIISDKDIKEIKKECETLCESCRNYYFCPHDETYKCAIFGDLVCRVNTCEEYNKEEYKL